VGLAIVPDDRDGSLLLSVPLNLLEFWHRVGVDLEMQTPNTSGVRPHAICTLNPEKRLKSTLIGMNSRTGHAEIVITSL
jgi:hypothetical protein